VAPTSPESISAISGVSASTVVVDAFVVVGETVVVVADSPRFVGGLVVEVVALDEPFPVEP
jgi:hypothetical protein